MYRIIGTLVCAALIHAVSAEPNLTYAFTAKRVLVPQTDIGTLWRDSVNYDDSLWLLSSGFPGGIGYEADIGYESLISLFLDSLMYDKLSIKPWTNTSCYIRIRFNLDSLSLHAIKNLVLRTHADDGFIAYINGIEAASLNAPVPAVWNSKAVSPAEASFPLEYVVSAAACSSLHTGINLLAVHGLNTSTTSSDFLITVELVNGDTSIDVIDFDSSNLPIIILNTSGRTIVNDIGITADMKIVYDTAGGRNRLSGPFNNYNGPIAIELRGQMSQTFPKKSYSVETRDSLGNNANVSLLGLPSENDWVLYAPYTDKTLLRNALAFASANRMGRYASRTRFCELVLNGKYLGVYILMEKIKRDKGRVAIAELTRQDTALDQLTGGYIVKIDKEEWKPGFVSPFPPYAGASGRIKYQYHYPKADSIMPQQARYISSFVNQFETCMNGSAYSDPAAGYRRYIDTEAFADYLLMNELAKNVDELRVSTFLFKDRDSRGGKLCMGPLWDLDIGFGNADYHNGYNPRGWELDYLTLLAGNRYVVPFWWKILFNDQHFRQVLHDRWNLFRTGALASDTIEHTIDSLWSYTAEARARNFKKWPIIGTKVWPNYFIGTTDEEELTYLKTWITARLSWMDSTLNGFTGVTTPRKSRSQNGYTVTMRRTGGAVLIETGTGREITVSVFDLKGRLLRRLEQARGGSVLWDGCDRSLRRVGYGTYYLQIDSPGTTMRLAILMW